MASTEDRAPLILAVLITGTAIATIIVALRFWVRGYILRKVGPDDWVVLASLVRGFFLHSHSRSLKGTLNTNGLRYCLTDLLPA